MDFGTYVIRRWLMLFAWMFLGAMMSLVVFFVQPLEYSSSVRLLIVQKSGVPQDAYAAYRSVESISENLVQLVHTSSFLELILREYPDIDRSVIPHGEYQRRKKWRKTVQPEVMRGTGFLKVTVYHRDRREASRIASAVARVLASEGWKYVSATLEVKLVDAPLESRFIGRPNIFSHLGYGLFFGGVAGVLYLERRRRRLLRLIHKS